MPISQLAKRRNAVPAIVQFVKTLQCLLRFSRQLYLLLWELILMISKTNYQIHGKHYCSHGNGLKASGDHESRPQISVEDIKV